MTQAINGSIQPTFPPVDCESNLVLDGVKKIIIIPDLKPGGLAAYDGQMVRPVEFKEEP